MGKQIVFDVIVPAKPVVNVLTSPQYAVEVQLPGVPGHSPVKGVDYFTESDKAEMVQVVKSSLTSETWMFTLEDGSTVEKKVLLA